MVARTVICMLSHLQYLLVLVYIQQNKHLQSGSTHRTARNLKLNLWYDLSWLAISPESHSPFLASVWATELSGHPDKVYVKYILPGISKGFRNGFDRRQYINSASNNVNELCQ